MSYDDSTGILTFTPIDNNDATIYKLRFCITDDNSVNDPNNGDRTTCSDKFEVEVIPFNTPPILPNSFKN